MYQKFLELVLILPSSLRSEVKGSRTLGEESYLIAECMHGFRLSFQSRGVQNTSSVRKEQDVASLDGAYPTGNLRLRSGTRNNTEMNHLKRVARE